VAIVGDIIVRLPAFLLGIILHEVAHGYAAYLLGDDTAKRAGRLTLSPVAHFDPFGALFFIITSIGGVGFGWAKPVPVATELLRNPRRDDILVSLAGPAANFGQAVVWAVLLRLLYRLPPSDFVVALATFCGLGVLINVVLMVFNLLPIPPLDGSHVALRLLGFDDPTLPSRLAPIGFVALFLLLGTSFFRGIFSGLVWRVLDLFVR
jgi:Zn-dependent protease